MFREKEDFGQQPCGKDKLKKCQELDRYSECSLSGREIEGLPSDSESWDSLPAEVDNSLGGDVKKVKDRRTACSKISKNESPRTRKRHAPHHTDSDREQPWHARCSNLIVNLPITLSEKVFSQAHMNANIACKEFKYYNDRGVSSEASDDSKADYCSCHKDVGTGTQVSLESGNRVKPLLSRRARLLKDERKSHVTQRKAIPKCVKTAEDSFTEFESHRTRRCSDGIKKFENVSSSSFSNWPAVIAEKFSRSQSNYPRRSLMREKRISKERDTATNDLEVNPKDDSQCGMKKGRLMLKKYTISKSRETMEEILCFDVLTAEEEEEKLANTRSKVRSKVRVRIGSSCTESKKKIKTIEKRDIKASRKTLEKIKNRSNHDRNRGASDRRKLGQTVEKNTSTGQIFLTNLIAKLLKGGGKCHKEDKKTKSEWESGGSRQRRRNVSRKYASTSIHRKRNKRIKCSRNGERDALKNGTVCCSVNSCNFAEKNKARSKIPKDFSSGRRRTQDSEFGASIRSLVSSEEDIKNSKNACEKKSRIMAGVRTARTKENVKECRVCKSCGSSRLKGLVKSGVVRKVIDPGKYCQMKREETEIHEYRYRDESALEKEFGDQLHHQNPKNSEILRSMKSITCGRNGSVEDLMSRTCERLIVRVNEISDPVENRTDQFLAEGLRRTFVIAGDNIRVKMLYDHQTSTELLAELPTGSKYCQSYNPLANGGETPSIQGENSLSKSAKFSEEHSDRTPENKREQNVTGISQALEECLEGQGRENDTSKVSPERIFTGVEGEILSSFQQETREERGETVCTDETCLYKKTLIKSASKGEAEEEEEESVPAGDVITSINPTESLVEVGHHGDKDEEKEDKKEGETEGKKSCGENETFCMREDLRLPKLKPCETGKGKTPAVDGFGVKKPKSRNIINTYYSQEKRAALSRHGVTDDKIRGKGEKIREQRGEGSALDKSILAKVRCRAFQRIGNSGQVAYSNGNSVTVKNHADKSDTREVDGVEKKRKLLYDKANDDSYGNLATPPGSLAIPLVINGDTLVAQILEPQDSSRFETDTRVKNTSEKRHKPEESTKKKAWSSVGKGGKSSNTKLEKDFRKSDPSRKGNSGRAISKSEGKDRMKEAEGKKIPGTNAGISESSNRQKKSVDIPERRSNRGNRELIALEKTKKRSLQGLETREGRGKDTGGSPRIGAATRKSTSENNKKIIENKSKSKELGSERIDHERREEFATSKLSSQINFVTDARDTETTSADLCPGTLMDGRNNVESYHDLQSPVDENYYSNRISTSRDDASRGSIDMTALKSKHGILRPQKMVETKIEKKVINAKLKAPLNNNRRQKKSDERPESDSQSSRNDSTKYSLINHKEQPDNDKNREVNYEPKFNLRRNSSQDKHLEASCLPASRNDPKKKSLSSGKTSPDSRIMHHCVKSETSSIAAASKAQWTSGLIKPADTAEKATALFVPLYEVKKIKCIKKSADPESNKINEEKEIAEHEYDDVEEKPPFPISKSQNCGAEKICNPLEKNCSFTDDLKRFFSQGQEFFMSKRPRIFQQNSSCSNCEGETLKMESKSCRIRRAEADDRELGKSLKMCSEDQANNNSISSVEKTLNTLKTIFAKRKGVDKNSVNEGKRTKERRICGGVEDTLRSCKIVKSVKSKTIKSEESLTVSISFGSSILSDRNLPDCKDEKEKKL